MRADSRRKNEGDLLNLGPLGGAAWANTEEDDVLAGDSKARRWGVADGRNSVRQIEQSLADPTDKMGMMMLMDGLESGRLPRVVETHQLLLAKELPDVTVDGAQRQSGTVELAAFVDFRCTQWTSRLTDDLFYGLELSCLSHGWHLIS